MKRPGSALCLAVIFASIVCIRAQQTLRYNYIYSCNKERIVVDHCRKDSDQPGFAPTKPENDYCQVYYPDRPKSGGFDAMGVVLRGDLIKTLQACGAMQQVAPSSQASKKDADFRVKYEKALKDVKNLYNAEHYEKSIAAADALLKTYGNGADALYYKTMSYYKLNDWQQSVDTWNMYFLYSESENVTSFDWLVYGDSKRHLKAYDAALKAFENAKRCLNLMMRFPALLSCG